MIELLRAIPYWVFSVVLTLLALPGIVRAVGEYRSWRATDRPYYRNQFALSLAAITLIFFGVAATLAASIFIP